MRIIWTRLLALFTIVVGSFVGSYIGLAQTSFDCSNVTTIPTVECTALVAFYESTEGDNWYRHGIHPEELTTPPNQHWLQTNDPCIWAGIHCEDGSITTIDQLYVVLPGTIPIEIENLSNLEYLNLTRTWVDFPDETIELPSLHTLSLSDNQLTELPSSLINLPNVSVLYLSDNQLTELPEEISNLSNLWLIGLDRNDISSLPDEIGSLANLGTLSADNNQLRELPESIGNLSNLYQLHVGSNNLLWLPDSIGSLTSLQILHAYSNQLTELPTTMSNLHNLEVLSLGSNNLTVFPDSIKQLTSLRELSISSNQIDTVPGEIGNLTNLSGLWLYQNQIRVLPDTLGKLQRLAYLYLQNNQLMALPETIGDIPHLETLNLSSNYIVSWPESLANIEPRTLLIANMCEPESPALQAWLDGIDRVVGRTHILCSDVEIAGEVTLDDQTPIFGATVTVSTVIGDETVTKMTKTDVNGRYSLTHLPFTPHTVTIDPTTACNPDVETTLLTSPEPVALTVSTFNALDQNFTLQLAEEAEPCQTLTTVYLPAVGH